MFLVYSFHLSLDSFCSTIYVPKVDCLAYYCPYVARKLYSIGISGTNLKRYGLIVILKEGFDGVYIIEKCTEKCALCTGYWA